jgi:hypothetical protein
VTNAASSQRTAEPLVSAGQMKKIWRGWIATLLCTAEENKTQKNTKN